MAITFIPCGHWIYLLTSRLDFVTFSRTHPVNRPCIRFLFVGSGLCRRLPSHKHSHACTCLELVVLPLGSTAPTVDFHHLVIAHAGQTKKARLCHFSRLGLLILDDFLFNSMILKNEMQLLLNQLLEEETLNQLKQSLSPTYL